MPLRPLSGHRRSQDGIGGPERSSLAPSRRNLGEHEADERGFVPDPEGFVAAAEQVRGADWITLRELAKDHGLARLAMKG
ncbi:hypothetical protein [Mesorhizobium sp.]|uniref:hypothetical protein n=1 Tax=Mesorhizobium sp. TaxID=1871066 RepID=UPI002600A2C3|nr:hypothetical protein [Mesorhizobium sp.]